MLISPDNEKTRGLCGCVYVWDTVKQEEVNNVYSFDTVSKEAELMILNERGEVKVLNNKPALEKKICLNYKVINRLTKKEIV